MGVRVGTVSTMYSPKYIIHLVFFVKNKTGASSMGWAEVIIIAQLSFQVAQDVQRRQVLLLTTSMLRCGGSRIVLWRSCSTREGRAYNRSNICGGTDWRRTILPLDTSMAVIMGSGVTIVTVVVTIT